MPPFARRAGRPGLIGVAARTAVVTGTASAVGGSMARRQQQAAAEQAELAAYRQQQTAAQAPAPVPPAPVAPAAPQPAEPDPGDDLIGRITELARLHAAGVLTDEEFSAAKAQLLD